MMIMLEGKSRHEHIMEYYEQQQRMRKMKYWCSSLIKRTGSESRQPSPVKRTSKKAYVESSVKNEWKADRSKSTHKETNVRRNGGCLHSIRGSER